MRKLLQGMVLSCVLVALTGCGGMAGHWTMASMEPESAKAEFPMVGLRLHDDGTFVACMESDSHFKGTWEYDADAQLLTFQSAEGKKRTYKASLGGLNNRLLVSSTEEGKDWKAEMKRGKCPGKCSGHEKPDADESKPPKYQIEK